MFSHMGYDENLELSSKGYTVEDPETLKDLGVPNAEQVNVSVDDNGFIIVEVHEKGNPQTLFTHLTSENVNNYLSLQDLYLILNSDSN